MQERRSILSDLYVNETLDAGLIEARFNLERLALRFAIDCLLHD